jgi:putative chitinase
MSDNFSIAEMTESSIAVRLGVDNTPSLKVIEHLGLTVTGLERVRALLGFPVHVNSGYRCEAFERILSERDFRAWCAQQNCSADDEAWQRYFTGKAHVGGYAADFTCAQFGSPGDVFDAIVASEIRFDQCGLEGSWVHISFDPRLRRHIVHKQFDALGVSQPTT